MNYLTKQTVLSTSIAALMTASLAPTASAGNSTYKEKRNADEYWSEFKQDAEQSWDTTKVAFRDGWIEGKLETALIMNEHLNPFDIDISVDNNVATLEGDVSSDIDIELASNIALGIEGIDEVKNELTIEKELTNSDQEEGRDFAQYVEDLSTTAAIKSQLVASSNVSALDVNIDTFRDEVTLQGRVDTEAEKELIEAIAAKHDGVESVDNQLKVQS
ncbi:BON domain-containing protein [Gilvimarinus sp. 1_MG-2023]|uniref:BON domain-containing protein n=1 Tax=Gilvimarinus sp. 1_MG-2023 TaxID=3062638 RepID=UPI0026E3C6B1|nr:BON domain-containing protein [Gilvimarinus sp. 1_MG-2023]MDO6746652.1 BON domain-containing protein [Gilvimarinus sp. 1_MG-2023]